MKHSCYQDLNTSELPYNYHVVVAFCFMTTSFQILAQIAWALCVGKNFIFDMRLWILIGWSVVGWKTVGEVVRRKDWGVGSSCP